MTRFAAGSVAMGVLFLPCYNPAILVSEGVRKRPPAPALMRPSC